MTADEFKSRFLPLHGRLYATAFRLLGNESDAQDVVQDTYLKLWKMRDMFPAVSNDEAYCVTMTRNLALDMLKSLNRHPQVSESQATTLLSGESTERTAERHEASSLIMRCIAALPPQQQQVIRLRELEDYSIKEICKETGLSSVNVRVTLTRARRQLKQQLAKYDL